jgi:hypothetical protein
MKKYWQVYIILNDDLLVYDHLAFAGINIRPGFTDSITEEGDIFIYTEPINLCLMSETLDRYYYRLPKRSSISQWDYYI